MKCFEIKITGIVQGVGFRPFIFVVADKFSLKGDILNNSSGVFIHFEGDEESIQNAIEYIKTNNPRGSKIETLDINEIELKDYEKFEILKSSESAGAKISISPDLSICEKCKDEMEDKTSRFYNYPFTSCASCGPRFTILEDLPYDRPYTSMVDFEMCEDCRREYTNPLDRRYHAQTISCPNCGPKLWINSEKDSIDATVQRLTKGQIVAVKGIGGYHLACDAKNDIAVNLLRKRKNRPHKPFAVMMNNIDTVKRHCLVSEVEEKLLLSAEAPIVLLQQRETSDISKIVNPNIGSIGVMLAYTPLHKLLLENFEVLVMTSANKSSEPIIVDEKDAANTLEDISDAFLNHNRRIVNGCDDSVARCLDDKTILIRRSRGFVPASIKIDKKDPDILACGGDLKNSFGLLKEDNVYLSQYIGDLISKSNFEWYQESVEKFKRLLKTDVKYALCDMHPEYQSVKFAKSLGVPIIQTQHHHAHVVSAMMEHGINEPVIGIAFDGTGFGDDDNLWGGEFFVATRENYLREYHFEYLKMPGGESAVKEPWRMGISLLNNTFGNLPDIEFVSKLEEGKTKVIQGMIKSDINSPRTSSVGRLFDGISSILGIRDIITYEGQAAIELEESMASYVEGNYDTQIDDGIICTKPIVEGVVRDIRSGTTPQVISAKFHNTIIDCVVEVCNKIYASHKLKKVVLSGGVFQNINILTRCIARLSGCGFEVYINEKVPINDGGLALGQIGIGLEKIKIL